LAQVEALALGGSVVAPPREVLEVTNALAAYDALSATDGDGLAPWSVADFLRAHGLLTAGLVAESGAFRTVDVEIVNAVGEVIHTGSRAQKVPRLVAELFEWGGRAGDHPLIVSSATHFLIEHSHPFRDGNGRIGRLWQTLILSRWRPIFAWMPIETLIRAHQGGYYEALQASRIPEIDAAPFIDFMLSVITESLTAYTEVARAEVVRADAVHLGGRVGEGDGANVGVSEAVVALLRIDPTLSAAGIAARLGKSPRTIERHLAELKTAGRLVREGPAKTGRWRVIEGDADR
jgi:Fic family protein